MTTFAQLYCTVNDLLLDPAPPAGGVELLYEQIEAASRTIEIEIGNFIPIHATKKFQGGGGRSLYIPALLGLTGVIVNDEVNLAAADFVYWPDGRHWTNGPYSCLEVAEDAVHLLRWCTEVEGVEIPGRWGKYEEIESTGAMTGASQTDAATSLQVSSAAKFSPGMVALIGSEQEAVTGYDAPVAKVTTLNGAIDAGQESLTLANGALVNVGEIIRIGLEQMRILDKATHLAAVQRHWNKTLAVPHSTGADVDVYRNFTVRRGANGTTAAAHAASAGISRYRVPANILYLCKEITTLMAKKAAGGYAGKSGNAETGQTFYNDEIPRDFFNRLKEEYSIPG